MAASDQPPLPTSPATNNPITSDSSAAASETTRTVKKRRSMERRSSQCKNRQQSLFWSLPNELIVGILSKVASSSSVDLFNAKLSCRELFKLAEDKHIYQHISLQRIPPVLWQKNKQERSFVAKCRENGNPEALFRQGVVEYFSHVKLESGFECLDKATKSGHYNAAYVLGIILLCRPDEFNQEEGMRLMNQVKKRKKLTESRQKLKDIIDNIWLNMNLKENSITCPMRIQHRKKEGWAKNGEDDEINCLQCSCNREIIFVCKLLRGVE